MRNVGGGGVDERKEQLQQQNGSGTSYYLILWVIMGMGTLFPYNAVISCVDYFDELYPGEFLESKIAAALYYTLKSKLQAGANSLNNEPTSSKNCINFVTTYGVKSPSFRAAFGFTIIISILLLFATISTLTESMTLSLACLVGAADAISQSGLYVLAANVNIRCSAAVSLGSALAGFAVNVLRICTKAIFHDDDERSAHVFFGLSAVFLFACLSALYLAIKGEVAMRSAFAHDLDTLESMPGRDHTQPHSSSGHNEYEYSLETVLYAVDEECNDYPTADGMVGEGREVSAALKINNLIEGHDRGAHQPVHLVDDAEFGSAHEMIEENKEIACAFVTIYLQTLKVTWKPTLMLFLMFFMTLSLFPGVVSEIVPSADLGSWYPIILITIFNAFDCLGRILPGSRGFAGYLPRPDGPAVSDSESGKHLGNELNGFWAHIGFPCLVRVLFFPLFILSNKLFRSDLLECCFVALFGFSNGYIACLCFMLGPPMLVEDVHKDAASLLLLLSAYGGLVVGALFGTVLHTK
eukprot:CAMPEP_0196803538 /NCGR_PEP_ID=MMETSP1362-20130617/2957_1 /TAXON_ID=163516 /ORGANISM="Leptocylindrus danicus, Strain CCMP1856" /LENGTH=523 /DNA_ID=CAMNT_0042175193 /DNA_START=398 /DNA_END=1968 /DNA_ORIENTATION=-